MQVPHAFLHRDEADAENVAQDDDRELNEDQHQGQPCGGPADRVVDPFERPYRGREALQARQVRSSLPSSERSGVHESLIGEVRPAFRYPAEVAVALVNLARGRIAFADLRDDRSEEHTSELQSLMRN